ncbi:MAG: hypothetical protein QGH25_00185 [Candidatus Latescibacteria bacterium]|jgi:hypothetical protein|nr:hypothetical protein [Candidatus Latescibacterota bacterium]
MAVTAMTGLYIVIVLLLAFGLLAVRDLSETKLRKLRSELLALRNHEQQLAARKAEVQQLIGWVNESLRRARDRQGAAEKTWGELHGLLTEADIHVGPVPQELTQDVAAGS